MSAEGRGAEGLPPDPYDRFETFLREWEPSVGTVAYWWTLYDPTQLSIHHNNDAVFSGAHPAPSQGARGGRVSEVDGWESLA